MDYQTLSPSPVDVQHLEQLGFSREHIASLESVKARYRQRISREEILAYRRLAFIRWLYLHGRLQS